MKSPGIGFAILTLPIPGFASTVGFAVCWLSGDGIQFSPSAAPGAVQFALSLLGQLLVGNEFFHMRSSFCICNYPIKKAGKCQINDL